MYATMISFSFSFIALHVGDNTTWKRYNFHESEDDDGVGDDEYVDSDHKDKGKSKRAKAKLSRISDLTIIL